MNAAGVVFIVAIAGCGGATPLEVDAGEQLPPFGVAVADWSLMGYVAIPYDPHGTVVSRGRTSTSLGKIRDAASPFAVTLVVLVTQPWCDGCVNAAEGLDPAALEGRGVVVVSTVVDGLQPGGSIGAAVDALAAKVSYTVVSGPDPVALFQGSAKNGFPPDLRVLYLSMPELRVVDWIDGHIVDASDVLKNLPGAP